MRHLWRVPVALFSLFGAGALWWGCTDRASTAPLDETLARSDQGPLRLSVGGLWVSESEMADVHSRLIHDVAIALADQQLRAAVYDAIKQSPYREQKLHLRTFLQSDGAAVLSQVAEARDRPSVAVLAALDSVVDLEFYMPVAEHRARWTGGDNLIVAGVLDDDGRAPVGYDLDGNAVSLDPETPPITPALVLVPVETDFSANPARTAGAAASAPAGTYVTRVKIYEDYEGWPNGNPEFEIHAFVEQGDEFWPDASCAGEEREATYYYWNYDNDGQWYDAEALVITEEALAVGDSVAFMVWEDDYEPCETSGGRPPDTVVLTWDQVKNLGPVIIGIWKQWPLDQTVEKVGAIFSAAYVAYQTRTIYESDEYVGTVDGPTGSGCYPPTGPVQFRILGGDSTVTGFINLDHRFDAEREPLCSPPPDPLPHGSVSISGPTLVQPNDYCMWTGSASGGTPPYTYEWYNGTSHVASGQWVNIQTGTTTFTLNLYVHDATGRPGSDADAITVSGGAPICFQ